MFGWPEVDLIIFHLIQKLKVNRDDYICDMVAFLDSFLPKVFSIYVYLVLSQSQVG